MLALDLFFLSFIMKALELVSFVEKSIFETELNIDNSILNVKT